MDFMILCSFFYVWAQKETVYRYTGRIRVIRRIDKDSAEVIVLMLKKTIRGISLFSPTHAHSRYLNTMQL